MAARRGSEDPDTISHNDRYEAIPQHNTSPPSSPLPPPSIFDKTPPSSMRTLVARNQSGDVTKAAAEAAAGEFGPPPPVSRGLDTGFPLANSVKTTDTAQEAPRLMASKTPSAATIGSSGPHGANKQPLQWAAAPKLKQESYQEPFEVIVGHAPPPGSPAAQADTGAIEGRESNLFTDARPEAGLEEDPCPPRLTRFYRLEPYSHGAIEVGQGKQQRIAAVKEISRLLLNQKVHLEFVSRDFQWNCSFTNQSMYVLFVVRLFMRQPEGGEGGTSASAGSRDASGDRSNATIPLESGFGTGDHVLEFSKRYGDTATFLQLFRDTLRGLKSDGPNTWEVKDVHLEPALTSSSQVLDQEDWDGSQQQPQEQEQQEQMPETDMTHFVHQVKAMIQSGLMDAILEGTRALAALSASPEHVVVLHDCEVGPLLFKTLQVLLEDDVRDAIPDDSSLTMVARTFAMTCLANLAADPTIISGKNFCDAPEAPLGFQLLVKQLRNGTYLDAAMRREATRTLVNLARDDESLQKLVTCLGRDYWEDFRRDFRCDDLLDLDMQAQARVVCQSIDSAFKAVC